MLINLRETVIRLGDFIVLLMTRNSCFSRTKRFLSIAKTVVSLERYVSFVCPNRCFLCMSKEIFSYQKSWFLKQLFPNKLAVSSPPLFYDLSEQVWPLKSMNNCIFQVSSRLCTRDFRNNAIRRCSTVRSTKGGTSESQEI